MTRKLLLECAADIIEKPQRWLWPQRIPAGALTLLVGDPSAGKSTLSCDIMARVTTGRDWPDGSGAPEPNNVIHVQAEDELASTVVPRLRVAGAARELVHFAKGIERRDGVDVWTSRDVDPLKAAVLELKASLITIDPLGAFMAGVRDGNDATQVRAALMPLVELASSTGAAVLAVVHPNKGGAGQRAMNRVSGSHSLVAVARAAWYIVEDRDDRDRRLMLKAKMNLSRDIGGMSYRIQDVDGVPRVEWEGPIDLTADDYLDATPEQAGRTGEAEAWIKTKLAVGPLPVAELKQIARKEGLAWRTIVRAKGLLGEAVRSYQAARGHYWRMAGVDPFGQGAKA